MVPWIPNPEAVEHRLLSGEPLVDEPEEEIESADEDGEEESYIYSQVLEKNLQNKYYGECVFYYPACS